MDVQEIITEQTFDPQQLATLTREELVNSLKEIVENGEITAIVVNNGCDTAENVTVDITAFGMEDTLLSTVDCGNIAPSETYNITYTVDSAYLEFDSPYVVNKFRIAAETSSVEVSTGNNDADAVYAPTPVEGITISSDKMTLIPFYQFL